MSTGFGMDRWKQLLPHAGFFLILLLLALGYYGNTISLLPFGIHDWAQGDRLALAINFYDRGMNLFLPATQNQMSPGGIVGVELPLQSYLAAALAHVSGRGSIAICFRLVDIAISWCGLYALFRAVFDRSRNFLAALIPPLLLYLAPVFVVYSGNFLPDPAAVSCCMIGCYFFLRYAESDRLRAFLTSISFMILAALLKASTLGYTASILFVACCHEAFRNRSGKRVMAIVICGLIAAGLFIAQYIHITRLNEQYHAWLFTARAHPFRNMDDVEGFFGNSFKDTWLGEYFLLAEYPVMMFLIVFGLCSRPRDRKYNLAVQPLPFFLGTALFMLCLFGQQLADHDYYMLPIMYPLISYALVVAMIRIGHRYPGPWSAPVRIGSCATLLLLYCLADHQIYLRMHMLGRYAGTYANQWVQGGAKILSGLGIPPDAQIVVGGDAPPNLSLVYFDRKGYVIPDEQWNDKLGSGTRLLTEKGLRYLIIPEQRLDAILRGSDSLELQNRYRLLYRGEQKAVLELLR